MFKEYYFSFSFHNRPLIDFLNTVVISKGKWLHILKNYKRQNHKLGPCEHAVYVILSKRQDQFLNYIVNVRFQYENLFCICSWLSALLSL